jgi:hypothetical protein
MEENVISERTCAHCDQRLPADTPPRVRTCDACNPKRESVRENNRRANERYTARRLSALGTLNPERCMHCDNPIESAVSGPLDKMPKGSQWLRWFCDAKCRKAFRESGKVLP